MHIALVSIGLSFLLCSASGPRQMSAQAFKECMPWSSTVFT